MLLACMHHSTACEPQVEFPSYHRPQDDTPINFHDFSSPTTLNSFLNKCYNALGEPMDLLALINAAIGFVLYGSMSKQFRVTFKSVFLRRRPQKLEMTRVTNINNTTTNV